MAHTFSRSKARETRVDAGISVRPNDAAASAREIVDLVRVYIEPKCHFLMHEFEVGVAEKRLDIAALSNEIVIAARVFAVFPLQVRA